MAKAQILGRLNPQVELTTDFELKEFDVIQHYPAIRDTKTMRVLARDADDAMGCAMDILTDDWTSEAVPASKERRPVYVHPLFIRKRDPKTR